MYKTIQDYQNERSKRERRSYLIIALYACLMILVGLIFYLAILGAIKREQNEQKQHTTTERLFQVVARLGQTTFQECTTKTRTQRRTIL